MPYLLLIVAIIIAKLYIKAGKTSDVKKAKAFVLDELDRFDIPREFSEKIISGVDEKVRENTVTTSDFVKALEASVNELASETKERLDSVFNSAMDLTKEARAGFARILQKAADVIGGTQSK
jgi:hypothetical protein